MNSKSRTANSLKNSVVTMLYYIVGIAVAFFSRKIFLDYLGTEILGLNTTAVNLLQFLNLAELGLADAVGFSLYKPLQQRNDSGVRDIVALQGHMYRRIGFVIIGSACVLMCFFPIIFDKMELPLWYAYASFAVMLFSALLGYFVNYRQIVLSASQQYYKIQYSTRTTQIIKSLCQLAAVYYFSHPYVWWLILEAIFALISAVVLEWVTRRSFPYLVNCMHELDFSTLRRKYDVIFIKLRQLIFHKVAGFALLQTSPLIIYAYMSLTTVAIYGNYMIIINSVTQMFMSMFSGVTASVGNLVAEGDKKHILDVFGELFSIRFVIAAICVLSVYFVIQPFICIWIGGEFLLPRITLLLMLGLLYFGLTRTTVDAFVCSYGIFQDIWAPVVEAVVNVGLSILFGKFWGLNGVLAGVLVSQILLIALWKPYFLFTRGLKISVMFYVKIYIMQALPFVVVFMVMLLLVPKIPIMPDKSFINLCLYALIIGLMSAVLLIALLYPTSSCFRRVIMRFVRYKSK